MRDSYRDRYEDSPGQTREVGLRRLGRLTWRTTQLGALATVGFAIVFARTAQPPAADVATVTPTQAATATATATHARRAPHEEAAGQRERAPRLDVNDGVVGWPANHLGRPANAAAHHAGARAEA